MQAKKIYLIDVSSMFFRAFYAIRELNAPSGLPVNAIYGFMSMVIKLLKDEKPDYMVFCYDRKEPSFRKEIYTEYKANRTEMPENLSKQMPYIMQIAPLLGIPAIEVPNYEADDIIGSLAHIASKQKIDVVIVSGDKDFGQLIGEHVIMYDTMKDIRYDEKVVKEKWGVSPSQFIDYLAIVGDTSDNIPGVAGIGPKGAVKLIEKFGTLDGIYHHLEEVDGKSVKEKLINCKEQAFLAKKLVTIVKDIPLSNEISDYAFKGPNIDGLRAFLQEMNFKNFEKVLLENGILNPSAAAILQKPDTTTTIATNIIESKKASPPTISPVIDKNELEAFLIKEIALIDFSTHVAKDCEVTAFELKDKIYLVVENLIYQITDSTLQAAKILDSKHVKWVGFGLKNIWHRLGLQLPNAFWDLQLAAYVLKSKEMKDFYDVFHSFIGEMVFAESTPAEYMLAFKKLRKFLEGQLIEKDLKIFQEIELPLASVLLKMENNGVLIDSELLLIESAELETELINIENEIQTLAGENFNVASPKQLAQILFVKLGLPTDKKTKTGFSTDNDVLEKVEHPIANWVLQYRELSKLKSTYVDALPKLVNNQTGRVHSSFNQAVTTTGRLSSTHPNLQNIPVRTERGRKVRQAFIAPKGMKLLSVDYSQIELRILAHISEDPGLCFAFNHDLDVHASTAAEVYGIPLSEVTKEQRRQAKAVNFGIAYGQGAFGLAESLGISRKESQSIIDRYFEKFAGVQRYIQNTIQFAHEKGFVETLFGRKRWLFELSSTNGAMKKFGERAAINAPIQGTASDIVKKAMIEIDRNLPLKMLMQVHDELVFEGEEDHLQKHLPQLIKILEGVVEFKVPLKVNYAFGDNWDEAH